MATTGLTSRDEPKTAEYAGDEVSALVLDPGFSSVRAGFAGEDTPKSIVPSFYASTSSGRYFGDHVIDVPREDVEIQNPINRDGIVEDWEAAEALWKYSFASSLTGARPNKALTEWLNDPKSVPDLQKAMAEAEDTERCLEDHPLFMTEPAWNTTKNREKCAEIALESWAAPAFYLGRTGVMAAFAAGRPSALVIDFGATQVSVTPVHDGMVLKKGVMRSNIGGNYLSSQVRSMLASHEPNPIALTPHYLVASKQAVDAGQPANFVPRVFPPGFQAPRPSFRRYQEEKVVLEFKEIVLQAWTNPNTPFRGQGEALTREQHQQYAHPFEFPDGYNQSFSTEGFRLVESLFDGQCYYPPPAGSEEEASLYPAPEPQGTIPGLVKASLGQVDVDIRPLLLGNVVITGAGSLIRGLPDRIQLELTKMYPSARVRIHASGMSVERKFGSWIGGSIVASLGTFHQMWISKKEYEEHGAGIVEKRCK
ncbi:Actin-related protein 4 [Exophiala dermatitidis]|uniref:Actin-like protein 4 n=2 Tax=Exophiala dermatitidis TaxID=5970 RepID=H6C240_EXODN|nr:actin-like protein 4 [Exophiala dermatitidis NIH/UT8656]EHY57866.1 actin-like protein 4 [Exophiala dermatitidis NIH/UT8656]